MRFQGTATYVAGDELKTAVNAAIALERPLLVKGEPGTGKTLLAQEIAGAIGAPFIAWHVKSTTRAQQGLYEYDAVSRLRDSQLGDPRVSDIANYIRRGKLWEAFASPERPVLLIDEIDKADIEFPNDLLLELDQMEFHVYETGETVKARLDPLAGLVDVELHLVEFEQEIVGEFDVRLVDLVDQKHRPVGRRESLPQLAAPDVVGDIGNARIAELRVTQA